MVKAAAWLCSLDLPVRLIAFPEGALQAFNDEVLDMDHVQFARECAIDIPGEETEALGQIARTYDTFIIAQAKARTSSAVILAANEQPICPKNLYLDREPMEHAEYRKNVTERQIQLMHERGIWVKPARWTAVAAPLWRPGRSRTSRRS